MPDVFLIKGSSGIRIMGQREYCANLFEYHTLVQSNLVLSNVYCAKTFENTINGTVVRGIVLLMYRVLESC